MALVYRSLVRDTLLPSEPSVIGHAAVAALSALPPERPGSERATNLDSRLPLPPWFGGDVDFDGAWLAKQMNAEGPWWSIFEAMTRAADKPHTGVNSPAMGAGMGALLSGSPRVDPGLALFRQGDGRLAVADVDSRGSAFASGLLAGDLIESIDGVPPRPSGLEVLRFYVARPGDSFELRLGRSGRPRTVAVTLHRGTVPVVTSRMLPGRVAYVNVRWFASSDASGGGGGAGSGSGADSTSGTSGTGNTSSDTAASVRAALAAFVANGAKGIVFDLRSGMGGSMAAVADILSAMTDATTIAAVLNEEGEPVEYPRSGERLWPGRQIAVLVNEQSTSAAEFLAVGLEEWAGAALVGTTTSGGLNFLRFVDLADGYRLVLPEAAGIGPRSLRPRQGHRLEPTIYVPNPSGADLAAGIDQQLEIACQWILGANHNY